MFALSWFVAARTAPLAGGAIIDAWGPNALWALLAGVGTVAAPGYALPLRWLPSGAPVPPP